MKKLAVIITHPIQYYSPFFKCLAKRNEIDIKIFRDMPENPRLYFIHSCHLKANKEEDILSKTSYGYEFTISLEKENIIDVQSTKPAMSVQYKIC